MDVHISPWITMPLIGTFIGWFTNYVAVKMLFHPRDPIVVFGFVIQGVFPRRQAALAEKLGTIVAEQLITTEDIVAQIGGPQTKAKIRSDIQAFLDSAITERLPAAVPMVAMFLSPSLIETVKSAFTADLDLFIDNSLSRIGDSVKTHFDIKEMVRSKVAAYSSDRLEQLLTEIMKKEFAFIEVIGGILGALIGLVQAALI